MMFGGCANNFDFVADFEYQNNYLSFDTSSNNFNQITNVIVAEEDSQKILYSVEGNFEATYTKPDNTTTKITGKYKTQIEVLK